MADSWTAVPTTGAPAARVAHTAVWTGSEMIVWGGLQRQQLHYFNDGGRYNPAANIWTALPTTGAPAARVFSHGGMDRQRDDRLGRILLQRQRLLFGDGGRYNADGQQLDGRAHHRRARRARIGTRRCGPAAR